MSLPCQDRLVTVHGRPVRVTVRGSGRPVLLINGLGSNVGMWSALLPELRGLKAIAFDAPGVGQSPPPRGPYTISRLADVARSVLRELDIERADVLGYSLGGAVAQRLAFESPDLVRRLVLASTSCGTAGVPGRMRSLVAVTTPARHYSETAHRVAMELLTLAPAEKQAQLMDRQADWYREAKPSVYGYSLQVAAFTAFHSLPWLGHVTQPTLVLSGSHDTLMPLANAAILAAYLPHARMRVFERWGHYFLHDATSGAGADVAEFLGARDHGSSAVWRSALTVTRANLPEYIASAPRTAHWGQVTGGIIRRLYPLRDGGN